MAFKIIVLLIQNSIAPVLFGIINNFPDVAAFLTQICGYFKFPDIDFTQYFTEDSVGTFFTI